MANEKHSAVGYLPGETPPIGKLILYALQQVIVMFPATVAVALITGFQVSTTIFASGLATLCFILITGKKIPLYYGSSFAYLTAISSMCAAEGFERIDGILPTVAIQHAQFGIIMSGIISIIAGVIIRFCGRKAVETVLPPAVTGSVAMIIGLTLAGNALGDAIPAKAVNEAGAAVVTAQNSWWIVVSLVFEQPFATSTMIRISSTSAAAAMSSGRFLRSHRPCFLLFFIMIPPSYMTSGRGADSDSPRSIFLIIIAQLSANSNSS